MRIAFRTDASVHMGTGHVMRCLTLADALSARGAECLFVCRLHEGHLSDLIRQRGHQMAPLAFSNVNVAQAPGETQHAAWLGTDWTSDVQDTRQVLADFAPDWLVVDHYALDARWEQALRPDCSRLMVIDDLADRSHDCDLLLDQNLGRAISDYQGLLSPDALVLIGPEYALLRPEFALLRGHSLARRENPQFKSLLISMGGVDKDNATGHVLSALSACNLPAGFSMTVVMGPHAPWLKTVQLQALQMPCPTQVLVGISHMAQLMSESDLAIGAAGGTAWERCSLGLPSLLLVLADNQSAGALSLQKAGAAVVLQSAQAIEPLMRTQLLKKPGELLTQWSHAAARITDGKGVEKIIDILQMHHA